MTEKQIAEVARAVAKTLLPHPSTADQEVVAAAVREAVAAERERCARLVEGCRGEVDEDGGAVSDQFGHWEGEWFIPDTDAIAAAIREGN